MYVFGEFSKELRFPQGGLWLLGLSVTCHLHPVALENERKILYAGKCPKRHFLETSSCVFLFLRAQMALRRDKHKGCESAVTGPCRDRGAEQQTREASALRHCTTGPESPGPTCGPRAGLQRGSHASAPGRQPHAFTPAHHASGLAGHITVTRWNLEPVCDADWNPTSHSLWDELFKVLISFPLIRCVSCGGTRLNRWWNQFSTSGLSSLYTWCPSDSLS